MIGWILGLAALGALVVGWPAYMLVSIRGEQRLILERIDEIQWAIHCLRHQGRVEMATIEEILASVQELPTINDSLEALFVKLQEIIAQLQAGGTLTPAQQAALDQINALVATEKERTKAAIVANTPAAPLPN